MSEFQVNRVLIANRGEIARRLIRYYKERGVESVVAFSEADAEQDYLDEADYAVYLNGRTVNETYLDPQRVVSAALDAGCEAVHPGYCFLAEHVDFYALATNANLAVYGCDATNIVNVVDRQRVREIAASLRIPTIPATDPLEADDDGVAAAAQLGFPCFVKAVAGGALARVESLDEVAEAVADIRKLAKVVSGDPSVFIERAVDDQRHIGVPVLGDRAGKVVHLGCMDGSLEVRYHTWVEELGPLVGGALSERITNASVQLARALQWTGLGKVRWAVTPDGGWYLLGFSARLAKGYSLTEAVYDIDLLQLQAMTLEGETIPWKQEQTGMTEHAIQLRIHHVDPETLDRHDGVITKLVLPQGVSCDVGVNEGAPCSADSEPLLVKITATGPTRQAALVKARAALGELVIEGVDTNIGMLERLFDHRPFWEDTYDVRTLERLRVDQAD